MTKETLRAGSEMLDFVGKLYRVMFPTALVIIGFLLTRTFNEVDSTINQIQKDLSEAKTVIAEIKFNRRDIDRIDAKVNGIRRQVEQIDDDVTRIKRKEIN